MSRYYTGIGSRETPVDIQEEMSILAARLGANDWILRSGGANGADLAFENGIAEAAYPAEIYLPWQGFNGSCSKLYNVSMEALLLASTIHPCWSALTQGAAKLHGRNCYQVLGKDLKTPSSFVICWTKNGESVGGTRTAIELAKRNNIPVVNMFNKDWKNELRRICDLDRII